MAQTTPQARELAHLLLASEQARMLGTDQGTTRSARIWSILRAHLVRLVGLHGYSALLARAVALARADIPSLESAKVADDGSLEGMGDDRPVADARGADDDPELDAHAAVLTHFIGLLVLFVGAALTTRILGDVFPEVMVGNPLAGLETKTQQ